MDDPWYEMGQDAAREGRSLQSVLSACETPYEKAAAMAGYLSFGEED